MTIYEFFPVPPKQGRLSCWSDILVWRGCGERSDSSAQVLRNSRPDFRLSPLETDRGARGRRGTVAAETRAHPWARKWEVPANDSSLEG
mgnify:CR=1 FL=1